MIKRFLFFIILLSLITGCSFSNDESDTIEDGSKNPQVVDSEEPKKKDIEEVDPIKEVLEAMSLDEKVGQILIAGINGYEVKSETKRIIEDYKVGGIIIYSKNIKDSNQLLELINSLKATNRTNNLPLFISIDEEGGRVRRLPKDIQSFPSNREIGKVNNTELSYEIGALIGKSVKTFGINMNFAPVLDIDSNPNNPVIGDRSFSSDKKVVAKLGIATMKGMQDSGVISVIKHFPGHGDTSVDSHIKLPVLHNDLKRMVEFELVPFEEAVKNGADIIMVAHILLPKIDPDMPSSLSKTIVTSILRRQLDFDGVVITDDITMGAIAENYNIVEAAIKALDAGADIILVAHDFEKISSVFNGVKKAVEDGVISEKRIDESVYRILKLKENYNLKDDSIKSFDIMDMNTEIKSLIDKLK